VREQRAARDGAVALTEPRRPFLLTRANHISGSRFAATWTGDNQSRWTDLAWSIPMALNLGLSGQPFVGPDIGGFAGKPTEELVVRWFELGAYLPFFRGHAEKESVRKEPWAFGEEAERDVRAAIERRMRLLPTLYTLFREAAETGVPPMRPVFFADPKDAKLRAIDDAFLLGEDLLVAPVVNPGQYERRVVLPRGKWYLFDRGKEPLEGEVTVAAPLGTTPVFARAGSIVVTGKTTMRAGDDPGKLTLNVFLDDKHRAVGRVYEDEGEGFAYREGRYRLTTFTASTKDGDVRIDETFTGEWDPGPRVNEVRVVGR
jgi:alpha-glucosidase